MKKIWIINEAGNKKIEDIPVYETWTFLCEKNLFVKMFGSISPKMG